MRKFIPLSVPNLKGNELKYVTSAIESEWVSTGGSYIDTFEEHIAHYLHVDGAVACQSGTAGLHLALLLSNVGQNDEVIVTTLTFIAAVNPIKYLGAYPVFMDCEDKLTLDVDKVKKFCEEECKFIEGKLINKHTNRQVKAIMAVHIFGNDVKMESLMTLAKDYKLKVVEDATEALGTYYTEGKYKDRFLGTIGDFGVYSFNGNKIITTGGGGMLVAKDRELLKKAKYLSTQAKDDSLYFTHNEIGFNYRMTNLQAALGVAQLEQLEQFIANKERNYKRYKEIFAEIRELELLSYNQDIRPNYWFYSLLIKPNCKRDIHDLIKRLDEKNIQTRPIWGLIHQQKPYKNEKNYKIEKAIDYQKQIINIPCSSHLTLEEVEYVADSIKELVKS